ncbi:hypothetical protein COOONC_15339 [Cooperia oncophora]
MGCFKARGIPNIYVSLIFNSVLLCCCYLLYTLDWMRHTTTCGQSGIIVSYVTASSSIFYANHGNCYNRGLLLVSHQFWTESPILLYSGYYADVAYMSVVCGYNLISCFIFSFVTILLLDSTSTIGTSGTKNLSGDSPRSCDKKIRSTTSSSIATIS